MHSGLFADDTNWSDSIVSDRLALDVGQQIICLIGHRPTRSTYADASRLRHFLLYTEATRSDDGTPRWKFMLQSVGGDVQLSADDTELNSLPAGWNCSPWSAASRRSIARHASRC